MEDKIKVFKKIMKKSESNHIILITNHYQIKGIVYECEECNNDSYINLTNARLCNLSDSYDDECDIEMRYDWLHINIDKVIAFSFI